MPFQSLAQAETIKLKNGTSIEIETTLDVTSINSGDIQGKVIAIEDSYFVAIGL